MCDRISLDDLIEEDRLEYAEYEGGFFRNAVWHKAAPTGRMLPTAAGARLLDFIRRHLNEETN